MHADLIVPGLADLRPGAHLLQFWVGAWSNPQESARLRKAWQTKGYLSTKTVRSEPMPFMIEPHVKFKKCD
jgi:hypothetical protein